MANKEAQLDILIQQLNQKAFVSDITIKQLDQFELSGDEQELIKQFKPEEALIIYGTLAPGKPNHYRMEHIKGSWNKATIWGKLESKGWGADLGFNGFIYAEPEDSIAIDAYVLSSAELTANWKYLDDFEGDGYKRTLAKYELDNGTIGIGYLYSLNEG